jgi:nucleoside-triphosphatase
LLLSGLPGVGKTTVLRKVVAELPEIKLRGFLTDEIRRGDERLGFRLACFDGQTAVLAHVDLDSPHRIGRYRVDIPMLIGKMECLSKRFVEAVTGLLDSRQLMVATVARKGGGFIERVKKREDAELWEVTRKNRDHLPEAILDWLQARVAGR